MPSPPIISTVIASPQLLHLVVRIARENGFVCNQIHQHTSVLDELCMIGEQYKIIVCSTGKDAFRVAYAEKIKSAHPEATLIFVGPEEDRQTATHSSAEHFVLESNVRDELPGLLEKIKGSK